MQSHRQYHIPGSTPIYTQGDECMLEVAHPPALADPKLFNKAADLSPLTHPSAIPQEEPWSGACVLLLELRTCFAY